MGGLKAEVYGTLFTLYSNLWPGTSIKKEIQQQREPIEFNSAFCSSL